MLTPSLQCLRGSSVFLLMVKTLRCCSWGTVAEVVVFAKWMTWPGDEVITFPGHNREVGHT